MTFMGGSSKKKSESVKDREEKASKPSIENEKTNEFRQDETTDKQTE